MKKRDETVLGFFQATKSNSVPFFGWIYPLAPKGQRPELFVWAKAAIDVVNARVVHVFLAIAWDLGVLGVGWFGSVG